MSAAALVPLLAMVGGAIDLSRFYMTRTRLQQACDAGALAGRKAMADPTTLTTAEQKTARSFFDFNFPSGTYASGARTRNYALGNSAGVVSGVASVVMPTTIMKLFGYQSITLNVACESTLTVPNTDIMFVLDVTGSMAQTPSGDSQTKIDGLKQAVKDFYAALGPGTANGPGRVRYGFMPYSSNVNVGKLVLALNSNYIAGGTTSENWTYQSRSPVVATKNDPTYGTESSYKPSPNGNYNWSSYRNQSSDVGNYKYRYTGISNSDCSAKAAPPVGFKLDEQKSLRDDGYETVTYPTTEQKHYYSTTTSGTMTQYQYVWSSSSGGTCQLQYRTANFQSGSPIITTRPVTWTQSNSVSWVYQQMSYDVSPVVRNASAANPAYYSGPADSDPNGGAPATISWGGCIEEAQTNNGIVASSSLTRPSDAYDLDIDLIPSSLATRWKPFLPQVQYARNGDWLGRSSWIQNGFAACPREASPLNQYASDYVSSSKSSSSFNSYVDSLSPIGGTYHDIGLIWGARFLSPTGIFSATNNDDTAPGGFQISRHIVFMTDGTIDTRVNGNDPWGITQLDGRVAPTSADDARNNETHSRRVDIICDAMKGKGFTIWVVGFGIPTLPAQLANCASDANHASVAADSAALRARFQLIAQTIGGLRLSS